MRAGELWRRLQVAVTATAAAPLSALISRDHSHIINCNFHFQTKQKNRKASNDDDSQVLANRLEWNFSSSFLVNRMSSLSLTLYTNARLVVIGLDSDSWARALIETSIWKFILKVHCVRFENFMCRDPLSLCIFCIAINSNSSFSAYSNPQKRRNSLVWWIFMFRFSPLLCSLLLLPLAKKKQLYTQSSFG